MKNKKIEQELIELFNANGELSVHTISKKIYVSEATARRYLNILEQKGIVIRTHGGAVLNNMANNKNLPIYLRIATTKTEKKSIAEKASRLIRDGQVIFLDASSTSFHLVPFLEKFNDLLVVTNSLKTAITLAEMKIQTICIGGKVDNISFACNDYDTISFLRKINGDLFFFSCDALSDEGLLSDNSKEQNIFRLECLRMAKKKVLLIDHSKLNKKCWYNLCDLSDLDYCFCDIPLPDNLAGMVRNTPNEQ